MTTVHRPHTEANAVEESVWLAFLAGPTVTAWRPDIARVVVVAPHPDDEVFALGGFIHDVAAQGGLVTIVAVTDGEAAYAGQTSAAAERLRDVRALERRMALERLGVPNAGVVRLGFADGDVGSDEARLTRLLAPLVEAATLVAAPWRHDGHPDHEAVARVTLLATPAAVPIVEYPVWAWQWAEPGTFAGTALRTWPLTAAARRAKRAAIAAFRSQVEPSPNGVAVVPAGVLASFDRTVEVVITYP
jgi:LmbE family N-acetylglucosaminyl deacetylase